MPELFPIFHGMTMSPLGLISLVLLVDCLSNKNLKGMQKLWWFLFIFSTQALGAILYFFFGPAQLHKLLVSSFQQPQSDQQSTPPTASPSPAAYTVPAQNVSETLSREQNEPDYFAYEQGYRPQQPMSPLTTAEPRYYAPAYEQPQAVYPEMTQEQDR